MMQSAINALLGGAGGGWTPIAFSFSLPLAASLAIVVMVFAAVFFFYFRVLTIQSSRIRFIAAALRASAFALLAFLLLDPSFIGKRIEPGEQTVMVLFDDSQSMQVRNAEGETRSERLLQAYQAGAESFADSLNSRFLSAYFRFGESVSPLRDVKSLSFQATRSDLLTSMKSAAFESSGAPVAAAIVFTDGAVPGDRNQHHFTDEDAPPFPVYFVGVGDEAPWRDLRVGTVSVTHTPFDQSPVTVQVETLAEGYQGGRLRVELVEGGAVRESTTLPIESNEQTKTVQLTVTPHQDDWLYYTVRLKLDRTGASLGEGQLAWGQAEEMVVQNNEYSFVVDNRKNEYRVLFYSGRPNWQHTFMRRALRDDERLRIASLILISKAEAKFEFRGARTTTTNPLFEGFDQDDERFQRYDEPVFIRIGVEADELTGGYPREEDELFAYDAVIWNEVDLADLSLKQLELTRDFVDRRGGAFLLLTGESTLIDNNFNETPLAPMLPVVPVKSDADSLAPQEFFQVKSTYEGELSGAWSLGEDLDQSHLEWLGLPPLFGFHPFSLTRAGATVMACVSHPDDELDNLPFYIRQRFGSGVSAVMAAGETWSMRMKSPLKNDSHERLWRQIVRSLVAEAPQRIEYVDLPSSASVGETMDIITLIKDKAYIDKEALDVDLRIISPDGEPYEMGVEESLRDIGRYSAQYAPAKPGLHIIEANASDEGEEAVTRRQAFAIQANVDEFKTPRSDFGYLQRVAEASGGAFFTIDELDKVVPAIPYAVPDEAKTLRIHLWHNPLFYALLVLLMAIEWRLRRTHGEA